jgi:hypothetical protein
MPKKDTSNRKGRAKGTTLKSPPIQFNKYTLMFYTTIKEGNRVVGRDYTEYTNILINKQRESERAQHSLEHRILKAVRKAKYRGDVIKELPEFIITKQLDNPSFELDYYESGDKESKEVTDKEATYKMFMDRYASLLLDLTDKLGRGDLAASLSSKWESLKISTAPPSKKQSQSARVKEELLSFKW